jgi:hypothetical protein
MGTQNNRGSNKTSGVGIDELYTFYTPAAATDGGPIVLANVWDNIATTTALPAPTGINADKPAAPATVDNKAVVTQPEAGAIAATEPAATAEAAPQEYSLLEDVGHRAHVLGAGLQNGVVGLIAAPETLWDMADGWLGGILPGDHNTSSIQDTVGGLADEYLISRPEIRDLGDQALFVTGGLITWAVPVAGVANAVGVTAKGVQLIRAFEVAENVSGTINAGTAVVDAAELLIAGPPKPAPTPSIPGLTFGTMAP